MFYPVSQEVPSRAEPWVPTEVICSFVLLCCFVSSLSSGASWIASQINSHPCPWVLGWTFRKSPTQDPSGLVGASGLWVQVLYVTSHARQVRARALPPCLSCCCGSLGGPDMEEGCLVHNGIHMCKKLLLW